MQQKEKVSYKDIKITTHAKQRAEERLGIRKESEIQRMACSAKYKGIKINALTLDNYQNFNLSYDMFRYLKNHYGNYYKSEKNYYYHDYVYVFAGKGSRSLKSIVPCSQTEMRKAIAKIERGIRRKTSILEN